MKWSSELKLEREQLELRVKQLSNSITVRNRRRFSIQSHSVQREGRSTKGLNASSLPRHSETPSIQHVHRARFTVTSCVKVCLHKMNHYVLFQRMQNIVVCVCNEKHSSGSKVQENC